MKTVTVEKARLVETLRSNRQLHHQEFTEALEGWRTAVLNSLAIVREQFATDHPDLTPDDLNVGYKHRRPTNHLRDYDRALEMLEWETGDRVELAESEFRNLVQDDWEWSQMFRASTSQYSVRG